MSTTPLTTRIPIRDSSGNVVDYKEVVTYRGLLDLAHKQGLKSIETELIQVPCDETDWTAIVRATVELKRGRFTGIGDARRESANRSMFPALIRLAETRAKSRALRDGVNLGFVALEELRGDDDLVDREAQPDNVRELPRSEMAMTSNQRRLLYRLLSERGIEGVEATRALVGAAGKPDVASVTKADASRLIDMLKREQPNG